LLHRLEASKCIRIVGCVHQHTAVGSLGLVHIFVLHEGCALCQQVGALRFPARVGDDRREGSVDRPDAYNTQRDYPCDNHQLNCQFLPAPRGPPGFDLDLVVDTRLEARLLQGILVQIAVSPF